MGRGSEPLGSGGARFEPPEGMGPRTLGVQALSIWDLGYMGWSLYDLGWVGRKPSGARAFILLGVRVLNLWDYGTWGVRV